jgi:hypothetical protein
MPTQKLNPEIVAAAIQGYEAQKSRIDEQIAELRSLATTPEATPRKRRKFSAETRRRMKAAQQKRWAKIRGEAEPPAPAVKKAQKAKRRISPEGMKRIIAATKKRWALQRAGKKPAAKKAAAAPAEA